MFDYYFFNLTKQQKRGLTGIFTPVGGLRGSIPRVLKKIDLFFLVLWICIKPTTYYKVLEPIRFLLCHTPDPRTPRLREPRLHFVKFAVT